MSIDVTGFKKVYDSLSEYSDVIDKRLGDKKARLGLPFCQGLQIATGGLKRQELVIVGGRPSNGKSVLMLNMATDMAKAGFKVHFFSLEMTMQECTERIICRELGIDNEVLNSDRIKECIESGIYGQRMNEVLKTIDNVYWCHSENIGKTFNEVLEVIEDYKQPDIIFIDYVQMIMRERYETKEAIEEYLKSLRNLAIKKNMCVVLGAQINRDGGDGKMPSLTELKSTGAIEEIADKVLIVHWEYFYTNDEKKFTDYEIRIAKNRSGRTESVKTHFYPQYSTIGAFNANININKKQV